MKAPTHLLKLLLSMLLVLSNCTSQNRQQERKPDNTAQDRQPAVAGQFYPSEKEELRNTLKDVFSKAIASKKIQNVIAIISPHAGYTYSGEVAASSFNQINPTKEYENIFVLGPSHHVGFEGASVYSKGNFITPLGVVKVNTQLAEELIKDNKFFSDRNDAQKLEHSVEVQLPLLQYVMKHDFQIVPIVIGSGSLETYAQIAGALQPYFNTKNLFVISTDFSHYPSYADAKMTDKATADAVSSNSISNVVKTLKHNSDKNIPNLATSMCGEACVLTLLCMTQNNPYISFDEIQYKNSGDAGIGSKQQVVGYFAIAVSLMKDERASEFSLNEKDKQDILHIARSTVEEYVRDHKVPEIDPKTFSKNVKQNCGAFVTLKKHDNLRGCIGRFDASEPLYKVVQKMAIASSTQDYRFNPVEMNELSDIEIEISVLTPMRKIHSVDEIEMGKHGIYIRKGNNSGTFLPQVATETKWTKEEFLGHCAQDKAGIGWDGWKDAEIYVYEALVFSEKEGKK